MIRLLTIAFILVVVAAASLAQNLNAQFQLTVTPPTLPTISGITLSSQSFGVPIGSGVTVASITTQCSVSPCPGTSTYSLPSAAVTGCTTAQIAQNSSFAVSGSNLNTAASLNTAQAYNVGIAVAMTGVSNSGACFPFQLQGTTTPPTLTVNGSAGPLSVAANSTMTVVAAGGPGNNGDYLRVCQNYVCGGPPGTSPNPSLDWAYLDCTKTSSGLTLTGGTCNITAPAGPANPTTVELVTNVSPFVIAVVSVTITGSTTPSITSVSLSASTFTVPFSGTVATISTACNTACPSSASYSLPTVATTGCTSAQIAQNSNFAISGSNSLVTNGTLNTAQTYNVGIVVAMGNVTNSGQCWPQTITGSSGGSGGLAGSILPPGTWINDLDEHFTGTSLPSTFFACNGGANCGGIISYCNVAGEMVFNSPGLTLYPLPWNYDGTGGTPLGWGCNVGTTTKYPTPGYFEARFQADNGSNVTNGNWTLNGSLDSTVACASSTPALNGIEIDIVESLSGTVGGQNVHWGGYSGCHVQQNINTSGSLTAADAYHVWGIQYEASTITLYRDGAVTGSFSPSGGLEPGTCNSFSNPQFTPFCSGGNWLGEIHLAALGCFLGSCTIGTPRGFSITWVRHYHH